MIRSLRTAMLLLSMLVITFFAMSPSQAAAQLSKDQQDVFNNYILYYNTEDQLVCGNGSNAGNQTDAVDRFLQVIVDQESHGDPKAANPKSSARGKYQYITSTWVGVTKANYPPASAYATADLAPEAYQDAVAKIEYTKKFKQFNSDVFKLAVSHFYPKANEDPSQLDQLQGNNKITPRQYANSIISKINSGVGTNIKFYYNEAPDFATFYAAAQGTLPTPNAIPGGCSGGVSGECGTHALNVPQGGSGVNVCYFNQADLAGPGFNWPGCGCLPTSSLMIRATMEKNPQLSNNDVLTGLRAAGGVYTDNCSGVIGGAISYFRNSLKYDVQTIMSRGGAVSDDILTKVKEKLGQGYLILTHTAVSVDSAGTHGTDGHFLLIHAVDAEGNFYVANPGARADNGKAVPPARIKTWLNEFYAIKK